MMNLSDWVQVALSLVVMLIALLFRHSRYEVLVTTRVASFGLALLSLSYFVGGFEHHVAGGPLANRIEVYSADPDGVHYRPRACHTNAPSTTRTPTKKDGVY